MRGLARLGDALARVAVAAGRLGAWATVPLMMLILVDVISRRFFAVGSTMLQELEWHFHAVLFLFCIGYAYIRDAHVRIDLVREHFSPRSKDILELLGVLLILVPFCAIMIWYSADIAYRAWEQGEGSPNPGGTSHWWIIKSAVPLGLLLLLLAGLAVAIRRAIALFAPEALGAEVAEQVRVETTGARDERRSR